MNKTKIDWVQNPDDSHGYTWNPVTGCYGPNDKLCSYCYASRIATRFAGSKAFPNGFELTWHPERLLEPTKVKKPNRIFVCSMSDIFADWVKDEWIDDILDVMADCSQHTFYLLTKQPQNIVEKVYNSACRPPFIFRRSLPRNVWLGTTMTGADCIQRAPHMQKLVDYGWHLFVSIEPMLSFVPPAYIDWASWVIIGGLTGPGANKHQPMHSWVEILIDYCEDRHIPVFIKNSLGHISTKQEWP